MHPWSMEKSIGQQKAKWRRLIVKASLRGDTVEAQDRIAAYTNYFITVIH